MQTVLNLLGAVVVPLLVGWVNNIRADNKQTKEELAVFRLKVAEEYVRNERLDEIRDALVRIEALLHTKADKGAQGAR